MKKAGRGTREDERALRVGFGRSEIAPRIGGRLAGYGEYYSTGQHDPLFARACVADRDGRTWCLLSLDLCTLYYETVTRLRTAVADRTGIPAHRTLVCTTHTHAGPDGNRDENLLRPLAETCAEAAGRACGSLQPAAVAAGYGQLVGYSLNRRWIHRPVDPAVTVVRFDDMQGRTLGLVTAFGCHATVLGMENRTISADYPGFAMGKLEDSLEDDAASSAPQDGPDQRAVCMFLQGGAGDVCPLTDRQRAKLVNGRTVRANGGEHAHFYGPFDPDAQHLGLNWSGGDTETFAEVARIGQALVDEVLRVSAGLRPRPPEGKLRVENIAVKAGIDRGEEYCPGQPVTEEWKRELKAAAAGRSTHGLAPSPDEDREIELLALGTDKRVSTGEPPGPDGLLIVGVPGEIFAETAVVLRRTCERMGWSFPVIAGYAGCSWSYMPPAHVYPEGGYEVQNGMKMLFSPNLTERTEKALREALGRFGPADNSGAGTTDEHG